MMPDIGKYLDFVLVIFLAFGASFELPVALVILVLLGWVTPQQLKESRGYAVVGVFVIAAIITPPDVVSQLMLAIPMCLLYEAGIIAHAGWCRRRGEAVAPIASRSGRTAHALRRSGRRPAAVHPAVAVLDHIASGFRSSDLDAAQARRRRTTTAASSPSMSRQAYSRCRPPSPAAAPPSATAAPRTPRRAVRSANASTTTISS